MINLFSELLFSAKYMLNNMLGIRGRESSMVSVLNNHELYLQRAIIYGNSNKCNTNNYTAMYLVLRWKHARGLRVKNMYRKAGWRTGEGSQRKCPIN